MIMLQHKKEIFCNTQILTRVTNVQTSTLHTMAIDIIRICNYRWKFCNQLNTLTHQIISTNIIWIWVKSIHFQDTSRQNIHDIIAFQIYDMHDCTMIQRHIIVEKFTKSRQFLFVRKFS